MGGSAYSYDANGNLLSGGGRTYGWTGSNLPSSVTAGGVTETYWYDADGARVARLRSGTPITYLEHGLWEETYSTGATKTAYEFNGSIVAVRDSSAGLSYVHGDHLGSISVATNGSGSVQTTQRFDPWGKVIAGGITQTRRNFTGQYLDETGLLYYTARYYDLGLGRFISADTVVPGTASGSMDGIAVKPLTVAFHEPGFVSKINQENQFGPWFTLSNKQREQLGTPWGPQNPQSLNRYSYVQNNPF